MGGANPAGMGPISGLYDFETALLDIYTGAGGGGAVVAINTKVDFGSNLGHSFVIDGGDGGNSFIDQGWNSGVTGSDNISYSLVVVQATPVITWANPADIIYGTALDASQLDASASVPGTFTYTPADGSVLNASAGQTLSVTFTPSDTLYYKTVTQTASINVLQATATVTLGSLNQTYNGTPETATATTDALGTSTFSLTYNGSSTPPTTAGSYTVVATLNNDNYQGTATGTLVIAKAAPVIAWANPADIVYGTALDASQLDASASVPGTFAYTPAAGSVLNVGTGRTLSVTFTPTDTSDYISVSGITRTINVAPAPLTITANNASIVQGEAVLPLSVSYSGFVNGDSPANLATQPTVTTPATPLSPPGSYPIVAGGASSPNYAINYASGVLVVTPAPVEVLSVSIQAIRLGKSKHTTGVIVLQFSGALNAGSAQSYQHLQPRNDSRQPEAEEQGGRTVSSDLQLRQSHGETGDPQSPRPQSAAEDDDQCCETARYPRPSSGR